MFLCVIWLTEKGTTSWLLSVLEVFQDFLGHIINGFGYISVIGLSVSDGLVYFVHVAPYHYHC